MIKIQYCNLDRVEQWHLEYVRARIKHNAEKMKSDSDENWNALLFLQKQCNSQDEEKIIQKIAIGTDLNELVSLQEEWLVLAEDGMKNDLRQAIEKLLDYESFYKGLKVKCGIEEMTWNRHALMMSTDTRVCPYCGRQYITSVKDNVTASCDHYYPKAQFPCFQSTCIILFHAVIYATVFLKATK